MTMRYINWHYLSIYRSTN